MGGFKLPSPASTSSASSFSHRILYLLTLLPLTLAAFAFALQWRGGIGINTSVSDEESLLPGFSPTDGQSLSCADPLHRSRFPTFPYGPGWHYHALHNAGPNICVTTSTSAGLEQILPWLFYHKLIGVTKFFLFVEEKAATTKVSAVLRSIPGVKLVFRTKELEEKQAKSRIWNETWLSNFFFRPCNYELFVKQTLNMEMAVTMAREAGMDWIIHLDTDELLHPAGAAEYSLTHLLKDVEKDIDSVIFPNYESAIERDDIIDPFMEISMFKKNYDHVTKETYFGLYKEATRGNPNYFLTYGNGKAAARIQDHLRPNGAHRWHNYMKTPKEMKLPEAAVLHYTYTRFADLKSRRDRCGCKPTKEDVKRCFMLEFDRAAFIIASTATDEEMRGWFKDRVVWSDKELNLRLMRKGLLTRIYAPMIIIQGLKESDIFSNALVGVEESTQEVHSPLRNRSVPQSKSNFIGNVVNIHLEVEPNTSRRLLQTEDFDNMAMPPLSSPSLEVLHREVLL